MADHDGKAPPEVRATAMTEAELAAVALKIAARWHTERRWSPSNIPSPVLRRLLSDLDNRTLGDDRRCTCSSEGSPSALHDSRCDAFRPRE